MATQLALDLYQPPTQKPRSKLDVIISVNHYKDHRLKYKSFWKSEDTVSIIMKTIEQGAIETRDPLRY